MFPQYETSAVCQANTVLFFVAILPMPTLLHSMQLQWIDQERLFTAMHAFETRKNEERITIGSYCDIMNTWSCVYKTPFYYNARKTHRRKFRLTHYI